MLLGILNHLMDTDQSYAVVRRLVDALAPGSYLVMSHFTSLIDADVVKKGMRIFNDSGGKPPSEGEPARNSCGTSTAWNCSTPGWSLSPSGDPNLATSAPPARYTSSAAWHANPDPAEPELLSRIRGSCT
jgi:hypothetical protein